VRDGELASAPPEGFVRFTRGPFLEVIGPMHHRPEAQPAAELALHLTERHTNRLGLLHGGLLSAFMDSLLGAAVVNHVGRHAVTVQLSINFLRMARQGEWLQGRAEVTHATNGVAFAEGRAFVGEHEIGRASGVFKLMSRPI